MLNSPIGPDERFELLFNDLPAGESSLPEQFLKIYPGDWQIPDVGKRPYIYTDFAISRDGRITYNEEGYVGGSDITQTNRIDWWFMAFLRTRADAIMNGIGTINLNQTGLWTAEALYPEEANAFKELRQFYGHSKPPILVALSHDGQLDFAAPALQQTDLHIVLATTSAGAAHAKQFSVAAQLDIHDMGSETADLQRTVAMLYHDYGVQNILSEGGSTVQAGLLASGLIDEEFVTWCPSFVGRSNDKFRPSYTEGVAWHPTTAPYSKPISLHRAGDLLYLRTRCRYKQS
jgi:riboflavin biosynthesis pyrimidine reductase